MIEIIEGEAHVFEVEITPDEPGWRQRTFSVRLLSGKPIAPGRWKWLAKRLVRMMQAKGMLVHGFEFLEE